MSMISTLAVSAIVAWLSVMGTSALRATWLAVPAAQSGSRPADDMVEIPAGRAWIGCLDEVDTECEEGEKPGRWMEIGAFRIDRTEVTVSEYRRCVRAGACSPEGLKIPLGSDHVARPELAWACNWGRRGREQHPLNCVSWRQAVRYCRWLGKRLPDDEEWEKAARGGKRRIRPWGDASQPDLKPDLQPGLQPSAGAADESTEGEPSVGGVVDGPVFTAPVGANPVDATAEGLMDMAGNVAEWTHDWLDKPSRLRTMKGGSWEDRIDHVRISQRAGSTPLSRPESVGFRCAWSDEP